MNHGGKREGSGRKAAPAHLKRNTMPVRLPQWIIDRIDSMQGSRGKIVENAVKNQHNLKEPKEIKND